MGVTSGVWAAGVHAGSMVTRNSTMVGPDILKNINMGHEDP